MELSRPNTQFDAIRATDHLDHGLARVTADHFNRQPEWPAYPDPITLANRAIHPESAKVKFECRA